MQQLRRRLLAGDFAGGMCLPSVRQLARETGFSAFTVQRALKQAESERWVERCGGNGTLRVSEDALERARTHMAKETPPVIHFVSPLGRRFGEENVFASYAEGISRCLDGCAIRRTHLDTRLGLGTVRRLIRENAALPCEVGYVLLRTPSNVQAVFNASGVACVIVGHADARTNTPCLYEDMYQVGYLTSRKLGNPERMVLLHAQDLVGAETQIIDGACRAAREAGVREPRWADFYRSVPEEIDAAEAGIQSLLSGPNRPTGILALRPELALGVTKVASRLGIRIPDELEVIGYPHAPVFQLVYPEITSIGPASIEDLGRRCGQLLAESFGRRPAAAPRELVDSVLIERGSTRSRARTCRADGDRPPAGENEETTLSLRGG